MTEYYKQGECHYYHILDIIPLEGKTQVCVKCEHVFLPTKYENLLLVKMKQVIGFIVGQNLPGWKETSEKEFNVACIKAEEIYNTLQNLLKS